jgi:hypothetical protein
MALTHRLPGRVQHMDEGLRAAVPPHQHGDNCQCQQVLSAQLMASPPGGSLTVVWQVHLAASQIYPAMTVRQETSVHPWWPSVSQYWPVQCQRALSERQKAKAANPLTCPAWCQS